MSKLFFDHILALKEVDKRIKEIANTSEERTELRLMVDEIIHHKVLGCILDKLPQDTHHEFLHIFANNPHDTTMIFEYLKIKAGSDIETLITEEIRDLSQSILDDLKKP